MSKFKKLSKSEMNGVAGGRRVVTYEDWDGDGIDDKVITHYDSNNVVTKRTVKYGKAPASIQP